MNSLRLNFKYLYIAGWCELSCGRFAGLLQNVGYSLCGVIYNLHDPVGADVFIAMSKYCCASADSV